MDLAIPVRVNGFQSDGSTWEETTSTDDLSAGGAGLHLKREVELFGGLTGTSIAALFIGGAVPGIAMAVFLMGASYLLARRRGYPSETWPGLPGILRAFRKAFFAILSPVIVLGGIVTGVTTPTEAAVIAVLYSLFLSMLFTRTVRLRDLPRLFVETGVETGVLMLIVGGVAAFSWVLTYQMIPQTLMEHLFAYTKDPRLVMLLIVLVLLVLGCFMNPTPGLVVDWGSHYRRCMQPCQARRTGACMDLDIR